MATLVKDGQTVTVPDETVADYVEKGFLTLADHQKRAARRAARRARDARRAADKSAEA